MGPVRRVRPPLCMSAGCTVSPCTTGAAPILQLCWMHCLTLHDGCAPYPAIVLDALSHPARRVRPLSCNCAGCTVSPCTTGAAPILQLCWMHCLTLHDGCGPYPATVLDALSHPATRTTSLGLDQSSSYALRSSRKSDLNTRV